MDIETMKSGMQGADCIIRLESGLVEFVHYTYCCRLLYKTKVLEIGNSLGIVKNSLFLGGNKRAGFVAANNRTSGNCAAFMLFSER
jgi:hypothetical protein